MTFRYPGPAPAKLLAALRTRPVRLTGYSKGRSELPTAQVLKYWLLAP